MMQPAHSSAIAAAASVPAAARRVPAPLLLAALLSLAGLYGLGPALGELWQLWTGDATRSIGLLIPPLSLWLALRAWTLEDWSRAGSWWGLPLMAGSVYLANLAWFHPVDRGNPLSIPLHAAGPLLWLYCGGAVLLFGGARTWRKAGFALALLLLVNPAPLRLTNGIDLQLQYWGAHAARAFAGLIGVPLDGDTLHLMFTPGDGVFIAPGCNGLRGAVTLGLMALVAGHLHRLRPAWHAAYVLGAILLAYLFNLVRLCCVVLYTAFTVRTPGFNGYGEQADYLMGGALFLGAALLLFSLPRRMRR